MADWGAIAGDACGGGQGQAAVLLTHTGPIYALDSCDQGQGPVFFRVAFDGITTTTGTASFVANIFWSSGVVNTTGTASISGKVVITASGKTVTDASCFTKPNTFAHDASVIAQGSAAQFPSFTGSLPTIDSSLGQGYCTLNNGPVIQGTTTTTGTGSLFGFGTIVAVSQLSTTGVGTLTGVGEISADGTTATSGVCSMTIVGQIVATGQTGTTGVASIAGFYYLVASGVTQTAGRAQFGTLPPSGGGRRRAAIF